MRAERIAVEVRAAGQPLRELSDALYVGSRRGMAIMWGRCVRTCMTCPMRRWPYMEARCLRPIKRAVLGATLRRALDELAVPSERAVVVGGPAGDDEVLAVLARELATPVGRGDVGGRLGHRHAVAYGLASG